MLSFSSIYNELQTDLMQQEAKLEIFAANNFAWLKRIKNEMNIEEEIPKNESNEKENSSPFAQNENIHMQSDDSDPFYLPSETSKFKSDELSSNISRGPILKDPNNRQASIMSYQENKTTIETPDLKSCLKSTKNPQNEINFSSSASSSSPEGPSKTKKARHVSFEVKSLNQDNEQISSLTSESLTSDSSDASSRASPLTCLRIQESAISNVTPIRQSVARQALHSSFDRISLSSRAKEIINKDSQSPYGYESLTTESSASYFPSDSEPSSSATSSPLKEASSILVTTPTTTTTNEQNETENKEDNTQFDNNKDDHSKSTPTLHRKFADINDIRLSLDPTAILLTPEELVTPSQSTYSVSSHTKELSQQAKAMREKWAQMIAAKNNKSDTTENNDNDNENNNNEEKESTENTAYIMSDHESDADDDDDKELEEFESEAEEIHGQKIPSWARGEELQKNLEKQSKIDPDTIFPSFSNTCALDEVFAKNNPRWQMRTDSAKWDIDGLTPEEIIRFKQAIGFV